MQQRDLDLPLHGRIGRLIPALRQNAPGHATILNTDGVELLRSGDLHADVILGNLPHAVTENLADLLPGLPFRVGVLAAGSLEPFERINRDVQHQFLTTIQGDDFIPPQLEPSMLVRVRSRRPERS